MRVSVCDCVSVSRSPEHSNCVVQVSGFRSQVTAVTTLSASKVVPAYDFRSCRSGRPGCWESQLWVRQEGGGAAGFLAGHSSGPVAPPKPGLWFPQVEDVTSLQACPGMQRS